MTSKQRSALKAIASNITPITQVGKGGIGENLIRSVSEALEARELVKLSVLETADGTPREIMDELAAALGAESVAAIGRKIILYRRSSRKDFNHIEF